MTKPAILGLCAMAAGCAAAGPGPAANDQYAPAGASAEQAQCFNSRFIEGFSEVDRDTVRIRVSRNDYYNLNVSAACTDLDWTDRLAVIARNGAFLCVGAGPGAEIVTREDRCSVLSIEHSPRQPAGGMTPFTPAE